MEMEGFEAPVEHSDDFIEGAVLLALGQLKDGDWLSRERGVKDWDDEGGVDPVCRL